MKKGTNTSNRYTRRAPMILGRVAFVLVASTSVTAVAQPAPARSPVPNAATATEEHTGDVLGEIDQMGTIGSPPERAAPGESVDQSSRGWFAGQWSMVRFFWPVWLLSAAIGIAGAVFGTFVLLRREALLALAVPQVVATGAAVGMRLGWPTLPPALVAASAALLYLVIARRREGVGKGSGTAVPVMYVAGLSLSFLAIAGSGAHVEELQNLFTGVDVAVTPMQAISVAPLLILLAIIGAALWRRWLLIAQTRAAADLAGVSPQLWDALFLVLLTAVLLLGTDSQGVVMVLAMLFLPAATVLPWARRVPAALGAATAASICCLAIAFVLSNEMAWPLSQSVGGVGFVLFLLSQGAASLRGAA